MGGNNIRKKEFKMRIYYPLTLLALSLGVSTSSFAKYNDGNWIENYLDRNNGSEISRFTDIENNSRWYYNLRFQGKSDIGKTIDDRSSGLEASLRLRGKTMFTDDLGFTGDFWLKAKENYAKVDGVRTNKYDDLDEEAAWENLIFGLESNRFGSLVYGKHTATWAGLVADIGNYGVKNIQADAGGKNAGKVLYKNHFENNLFVHSSYDLNSEIYGLDLGYQTANIYPFRPDSYGIYFSAYNGQPFLNMGYNSTIMGNADLNSDIKSDTALNRHDDHLFTYSISGYKQFGFKGRIATVIAYSDRNDDSDEQVRQRGYTAGGLGLSASTTYLHIPEGFKGWAPLVTASHDEFTNKFTPQMQYWFEPSMRVTLGYDFTSHGENSAHAEFQIDL
jgi:hypothetical protein